ncbi:MAG: hypothetical protein GF313_00925 [Caldithrix sp.]|nr:hypothetical protein [Caldithrix sp.]
MSHRSFLSYLDYFFVLRPMLFFPGWSTMLAGYFIARKENIVYLEPYPFPQDLLKAFVLMVAFASAMGAVFLLNQLTDVKSDRGNKKLFIIANGYIKRSDALRQVALLMVIAFMLTVLFNEITVAAMVLFLVITGYLYNYPPTAMKDHPWRSLVANALMGLLAFVIGWTAVNVWHNRIFLDSLPYILLNTALYLLTTLPDRDGDRLAAKNTLAVKFGTKRLIYAAVLLYLLTVLSALWQTDFFILFVVTLSAPFFIHTAVRPKIVTAVRATKFTILMFAIAVCLKFPYYLIVMVGLFFFTRWYFKKRFNYDYPNFKGK